MEKSALLRRCGEFAARNGMTLGEQLGAGAEGIVFGAKSQAEEGRFALKAWARKKPRIRPGLTSPAAELTWDNCWCFAAPSPCAVGAGRSAAQMSVVREAAVWPVAVKRRKP
jgi:hypothetical protein